MNINIKNICIGIFLFIACNGFTQRAWTNKSPCAESYDPDNIYLGYKIEIFFLKNNDTIHSNYYWENNPFKNFNDSSKLLIIEQLLSYERDTSLFCGTAGAHFYGGALSCKCHIDNNIKVPLQIDALYRINAIAFPNVCWIYSCYPVLYDTLEKKIINDKPELVLEVYITYKQWFAECIKKGKIGNYFPFNEGRYVWYGGRKSFYRKGE
jgi:hypothetical protein